MTAGAVMLALAWRWAERDVRLGNVHRSDLVAWMPIVGVAYIVLGLVVIF